MNFHKHVAWKYTKETTNECYHVSVRIMERAKEAKKITSTSKNWILTENKILSGVTSFKTVYVVINNFAYMFLIIVEN